MYEYIKGKIAELTPTYSVIETNGIGYCINISLNTYSQLEGKDECMLYLSEIIREDSYTLYGFFDKRERSLFSLLISVSGIGANTARMILSSFSVSELECIIATENVNALKGVKGIGLKTAQRVIIDLKDKVNKGDAADGDFAPLAANKDKEEALAALVMLGFAKDASAKAIDKILKASPDLSLEKIIKEALKQM